MSRVVDSQSILTSQGFFCMVKSWHERTPFNKKTRRLGKPLSLSFFVWATAHPRGTRNDFLRARGGEVATHGDNHTDDDVSQSWRSTDRVLYSRTRGGGRSGTHTWGRNAFLRHTLRYRD